MLSRITKRYATVEHQPAQRDEYHQPQVSELKVADGALLEEIGDGSDSISSADKHSLIRVSCGNRDVSMGSVFHSL